MFIEADKYKTHEGVNLTCSGYSEACGVGDGDHYMRLDFAVTPCKTEPAEPCTCSDLVKVEGCTATCGNGTQLHIQTCSSACDKKLLSHRTPCDPLPVSICIVIVNKNLIISV